MKLHFAGDLATPNKLCTENLLASIEALPDIFKDSTCILNLEGLLHEDMTSVNKPVLYNHPSAVDILQKLNVGGVTLANNHTLDIPESYQNTIRTLDSVQVKYCGAGLTKESADSFCTLSTGKSEVKIIGSCWRVMIQHQSNPSEGVYVSTIESNRLIKQVRNLREKSPECVIVVNLHWNFDLETAPFPLHRTLSKKLIDVGANVINGCHSHCIQGAERYNNGIIIYSPGNFFMPWYTYINGTLKLPEFAKMQMTVEWESDTNKAKCHFFKYDIEDGIHKVNFIKTEDFDSGEMINHYSPYRYLTDEEFTDWYKNNRRKGKLVPVYRHHENEFRNNLYDSLLIMRIKTARFLAEHNLREWNH